MKTCYSLFSGCGGSDVGMEMAGYRSIGGIEYHHPAADIFDQNHNIPLVRSNIHNIRSIPSIDLLWISPPCPSFSIANINKGETDRDIALATHIADLISSSNPRHIAIENVRGYRDSRSLQIIIDRLTEMGYSIDIAIYNAADYGTPTTRQRLIVRSSLDKLHRVIKTHQKPCAQMGLFDLPSWISWWDAVGDRVGELPRSRLTDNQIRSLDNYQQKGRLVKLPCIVDSANSRGDEARLSVWESDRPCWTITGTSIILLIERCGYRDSPNVYHDVPSPTIRSMQHIDDKGSYRVAYNIIDSYDCYDADVKCLAAWQGFPSDYDWGDNRGEAGRSIGNAVPPPLAKAIALSFG